MASCFAHILPVNETAVTQYAKMTTKFKFDFIYLMVNCLIFGSSKDFIEG